MKPSHSSRSIAIHSVAADCRSFNPLYLSQLHLSGVTFNLQVNTIMKKQTRPKGRSLKMSWLHTFFSCKFSQPQVDLAEKNILFTRTGSYKGRLTLSNAEMPAQASIKFHFISKGYYVTAERFSNKFPCTFLAWNWGLMIH